MPCPTWGFGGEPKNAAEYSTSNYICLRDQVNDRFLFYFHLKYYRSYFAGQYGAALMRYVNAFDTVQTVDAAELNLPYLPHPHNEAGLLVISQSGETKDVHRAVKLAEEQDIPRFSVINAVGSLIARTTRCGVHEMKSLFFSFIQMFVN